MSIKSRIAEGDERIVRIREIVEDEEAVFYAIKDDSIDYWRSRYPLESALAWTKSRRRRAEFKTRSRALGELVEIRKWRLGLAPDESVFYDDPEGEAA